MIRGKMFTAFCYDDTGIVYITVKCEPDFNFMLKYIRGYNSGYYMNKEHWNSIKVNGNVPDDVVKEMCDRGYNLILNSFSKKVKAEILGID